MEDSSASEMPHPCDSSGRDSSVCTQGCRPDGSGLTFSELSPSIKKRRLSRTSVKGPIEGETCKSSQATTTFREPQYQRGDSASACENGPQDSLDFIYFRHYADLFFQHVGGHADRTVSHSTFVQWFKSKTPKTRESLMLAQAMLAVGASFSKKVGHDTDGKILCEMARRALRSNSRPQSPQETQTRLLLALYYSTTGQTKDAWTIAAQGMPATFESSFTIIGTEETKGIG